MRRMALPLRNVNNLAAPKTLTRLPADSALLIH